MLLMAFEGDTLQVLGSGLPGSSSYNTFYWMLWVTCFSCGLLTSVSLALCFPVFKTFLIWDYCFLIGIVTDTGHCKSWLPQELSGHLLGFWIMIWKFVSFDGDITGFCPVSDRGPTWWLLEILRVLSNLGTGAAPLEGLQWEHSVKLTLLNTSSGWDMKSGSVERENSE